MLSDPLWLLYVLYFYTLRTLQNNVITFALINCIFKLRENSKWSFAYPQIFMISEVFHSFLSTWVSVCYCSTPDYRAFFSVAYLIDLQTTNYFIYLFIFLFIWLIWKCLYFAVTFEGYFIEYSVYSILGGQFYLFVLAL